MTQVTSSVISSLSYSEGIVIVVFLSGDTYAYMGVPKEIYDAFLAAESKGRYLNTVLKAYPARKIN